MLLNDRIYYIDQNNIVKEGNICSYIECEQTILTCSIIDDINCQLIETTQVFDNYIDACLFVDQHKINTTNNSQEV